MPYIVQERRDVLDGHIETLSKELEKLGWVEGDVNYTFYTILLAWFKHTSRYATICKIIGTLECVSKEFYSRIAREYEDGAIKKNGDIT